MQNRRRKIEECKSYVLTLPSGGWRILTIERLFATLIAMKGKYKLKFYDERELWRSAHRWGKMIWESGDIKKFNNRKFAKTGIADWIEPEEIAASIMSYIRGDDKTHKYYPKKK